MWPPKKPPSRCKERLEIAQGIAATAASIATVIGLMVGGFWTYRLFIEQREEYPHANIELKLSHVALSDQANLLRVAIELTNTGKALMKVGKSIIRVQQILPMLPCPERGACAASEVKAALKEVDREDDRFPWELLAERDVSLLFDIEPGEEQNVDFEFAIASDVTVVRIYAYFRNDERSEHGSEVGWGTSTYYDFRGSDGLGPQ